MITKEDISKITDMIIPEGLKGQPPASQSRAVEFIISYLENGREFSDEISSLLAGLPESSLHDEAALQEAESKNPVPFRLFVELVYTAYYGDPAIVEKLGLPGPPQPGGHRMKPFDANLLESVKKSS